MRVRRSLQLATLLLAAATGVARADAEAPKRYDGLQEMLAAEASDAMGMGDFPRAWNFYSRMLRLDPDDPLALRESGRAAHALGDFAYAEKALGRAAALQPDKPDPELHYIRAECLAALNRKPEAKLEYDRAERDIGPNPTDRTQVIWLGRIYSVRGDVARAKALYEAQLWKDRSKDQHTEIMMYLVEAHILAGDWKSAEKILREYISYWPDYPRAREMLAWVLEGRGDIKAELKVRASLLSKPEERPKEEVVAYARTLERAHDLPAALRRYREAQALGATEVQADIDRISLRLAPEVAAGMTVRNDPSGDVIGWLAGGTMSFGSQFRLTLAGWHEIVNPAQIMGAPPPDSENATQATLRASYTLVKGGEATAGVTAHTRSGGDPSAGGTAAFRGRIGSGFVYALSGEVNMPWRESASTIQQGGVADSGLAELYALPFGPSIVLGLTGRVRRLGLEPIADEDVHTLQLFGAAGVDWVVWSDWSQQVRGEILDHDLVWASGFAPALILMYRHYELDSQDKFGPRLVLVERSSLDEVSGVAREVLGDGAFAAEARGGFGYDWQRDIRMWRAGASILVAATLNSRLSLDYDFANESRTGLAGQRHTGLIALHVDL